MTSSWIDVLAQAMPPSGVVIGTITQAVPLLVSWDFGDPMAPIWSDGFDLVLSARGAAALVGSKVLLLLPNKQPPFISALVMGGNPDATD